MKDELNVSLRQMAKIISEMVDQVYHGFMENDKHLLDRVLDAERKLDDLERDITVGIPELSKGLDEEGTRELIVSGQVAEHLERMGDELRHLVERIEIKIEDKLYFSDKGVEQYREVFEKMRRSLYLVVDFLDENKVEILDEVLKNGDQVKEMIERYRTEHVERLAKGICKPRASNMYFDMLDFTGNVARHCTNIARIAREK